MSNYRMLQVLHTVTIPDFEIKDRKHPFDEYIAWHRLKCLKEPTDFNRYCYAKALFYDMQTGPAKYVLSQCNPNEVVTQFLRAVPLLLEGDFQNGLPLREYRLQAARYPLHNVAPQWDGKPTDKRLIIWQEGGFGDVVQYIRYLPDVLKLAPNASVVIDKSIFPLIRYNYPESLLAFNPQDFQLQCSLMSLPHLLGQYEPDPTPYLKCPPEAIEKWKTFKGHIGFVGEGNPLHSSDKLRSLTIEEKVRLIQGKDWVSLTPSATGAADWLDTAGIISNLKLVITVDTAVGHLAGALGVPVWVMMAKHHDWRWTAARSWYESMRIFRCTAHSEWEPVFKAIEEELHYVEAIDPSQPVSVGTSLPGTSWDQSLAALRAG